MRAYRKTTQHPLCVYLTLEEAEAFLTDVNWVISAGREHIGQVPQVEALRDKLHALLSDPKRERA